MKSRCRKNIPALTAFGSSVLLNAIAGLELALSKLRLEYLDLFLVHTPMGGQITDTCRALSEARDRGMVRAIGVSNFGIEQLQAMAAARLPGPG